MCKMHEVFLSSSTALKGTSCNCGHFTAVVTVLFLTASLLGQLFSDMVRVVVCYAGVLSLNPGEHFPLGITCSSLVAAVIL